jgi:general L-amino acid transport system substrate-binding protein
MVRWTLFAMIEGEEYGIVSKDVDDTLNSGHPTIKSILGMRPVLWTKAGILYVPPLR